MTWKDSFATLGRFDVMDIVESNDPDQVARATMIIRADGRSATGRTTATPWRQFIEKFGK